jgi:GTPase SAR1 family protein
MFLRGSDGILLMFDLTNPSTLERINSHKQTIDKHFAPENYPCLVLVGTKSDSEARKVEHSKAKELADFWNVSYFEVSAKTGEGVKEVMSFIVNNIQEKKEVGPKLIAPVEPGVEENGAAAYANTFCTLL